VRVIVEMIVEIPCSATQEEVEQWIKFETGYTGSLNLDNPLSDYELETKSVSVRSSL
jgi:hypothetical protein